MSTVEYLREFVNERLTAAAEEIFGVFQRTIVEYETEIDRQRRLLDIIWKPEIKLHRIELNAPKEEDLSDQQLCNQEGKSTLDQDSEPPQIKEEQEDLHCSQEGEQPELKDENSTFILTSSYEESNQREPELKIDIGFLSQNLCNAENQVHKDDKREFSEGFETNLELENNNQQYKTDSNSNSRCHSKTGDRPNLCKICGKTFACKSKLSLHVRSHTGERPYHCMTCGKRFSDIAGLKRHLRIHTGEKPYPCEICGKDFRHVNAMKVHMRTHTGERPYSCQTCEKRFCDFSALKRHRQIHTGEKPFTCKTCGKAFQQKSSLIVHIRVHTGERPYFCRVCGRDFKHTSTLLIHMKTHTKEKNTQTVKGGNFTLSQL